MELSSTIMEESKMGKVDVKTWSDVLENYVAALHKHNKTTKSLFAEQKKIESHAYESVWVFENQQISNQVLCNCGNTMFASAASAKTIQSAQMKEELSQLIYGWESRHVSQGLCDRVGLHLCELALVQIMTNQGKVLDADSWQILLQMLVGPLSSFLSDPQIPNLLISKLFLHIFYKLRDYRPNKALEIALLILKRPKGRMFASVIQLEDLSQVCEMRLLSNIVDSPLEELDFIFILAQLPWSSGHGSLHGDWNSQIVQPMVKIISLSLEKGYQKLCVTLIKILSKLSISYPLVAVGILKLSFESLPTITARCSILFLLLDWRKLFSLLPSAITSMFLINLNMEEFAYLSKKQLLELRLRFATHYTSESQFLFSLMSLVQKEVLGQQYSEEGSKSGMVSPCFYPVFRILRSMALFLQDGLNAPQSGVDYVLVDIHLKTIIHELAFYASLSPIIGYKQGAIQEEAKSQLVFLLQSSPTLMRHYVDFLATYADEIKSTSIPNYHIALPIHVWQVDEQSIRSMWRIISPATLPDSTGIHPGWISRTMTEVDTSSVCMEILVDFLERVNWVSQFPRIRLLALIICSLAIRVPTIQNVWFLIFKSFELDNLPELEESFFENILASKVTLKDDITDVHASFLIFQLKLSLIYSVQKNRKPRPSHLLNPSPWDYQILLESTFLEDKGAFIMYYKGVVAETKGIIWISRCLAETLPLMHAHNTFETTSRICEKILLVLDDCSGDPEAYSSFYYIMRHTLADRPNASSWLSFWSVRLSKNLWASDLNKRLLESLVSLAYINELPVSCILSGLQQDPLTKEKYQYLDKNKLFLCKYLFLHTHKPQIPERLDDLSQSAMWKYYETAAANEENIVIVLLFLERFYVLLFQTQQVIPGILKKGLQESISMKLRDLSVLYASKDPSFNRLFSCLATFAANRVIEGSKFLPEHRALTISILSRQISRPDAIHSYGPQIRQSTTFDSRRILYDMLQAFYTFIKGFSSEKVLRPVDPYNDYLAEIDDFNVLTAVGSVPKKIRDMMANPLALTLNQKSLLQSLIQNLQRRDLVLRVLKGYGIQMHSICDRLYCNQNIVVPVSVQCGACPSVCVAYVQSYQVLSNGPSLDQEIFAARASVSKIGKDAQHISKSIACLLHLIKISSSRELVENLQGVTNEDLLEIFRPYCAIQLCRRKPLGWSIVEPHLVLTLSENLPAILGKNKEILELYLVKVIMTLLDRVDHTERQALFYPEETIPEYGKPTLISECTPNSWLFGSIPVMKLVKESSMSNYLVILRLLPLLLMKLPQQDVTSMIKNFLDPLVVKFLFSEGYSDAVTQMTTKYCTNADYVPFVVQSLYSYQEAMDPESYMKHLLSIIRIASSAPTITSKHIHEMASASQKVKVESAMRECRRILSIPSISWKEMYAYCVILVTSLQECPPSDFDRPLVRTELQSVANLWIQAMIKIRDSLQVQDLEVLFDVFDVLAEKGFNIWADWWDITFNLLLGFSSLDGSKDFFKIVKRATSYPLHEATCLCESTKYVQSFRSTIRKATNFAMPFFLKLPWLSGLKDGAVDPRLHISLIDLAMELRIAMSQLDQDSEDYTAQLTKLCGAIQSRQLHPDCDKALSQLFEREYFMQSLSSMKRMVKDPSSSLLDGVKWIKALLLSGRFVLAKTAFLRSLRPLMSLVLCESKKEKYWKPSYSCQLSIFTDTMMSIFQSIPVESDQFQPAMYLLFACLGDEKVPSIMEVTHIDNSISFSALPYPNGIADMPPGLSEERDSYRGNCEKALGVLFSTSPPDVTIFLVDKVFTVMENQDLSVRLMEDGIRSYFAQVSEAAVEKILSRYGFIHDAFTRRRFFQACMRNNAPLPVYLQAERSMVAYQDLDTSEWLEKLKPLVDDLVQPMKTTHGRELELVPIYIFLIKLVRDRKWAMSQSVAQDMTKKIESCLSLSDASLSRSRLVGKITKWAHASPDQFQRQLEEVRDICLSYLYRILHEKTTDAKYLQKVEGYHRSARGKGSSDQQNMVSMQVFDGDDAGDVEFLLSPLTSFGSFSRHVLVDMCSRLPYLSSLCDTKL